MRARHALVALALVACKKSDDAKPPAPAPDVRGHADDEHRDDRTHATPTVPPPSAAAANPQPDLKATVDGKPVAMNAAYAWVADDGRVHFLVQNVPTTCAEASSSMREIAAGQENFEGILGKQLQTDGTFAWAAAQVSYGANTMAGNVGPVTVTGDATPGNTMTIKLAFQLDSVAFGDQPKKSLAVDGTVSAQGCPTPPPDKYATAKPAPPPAQAATMTVAGQKVPIHGAAFSTSASGDRELVLSSAGVSCEGFAHAEDDQVDITLHYQAGKDEVWQADLMGAWIDGTKADQIFAKGKPTATPNLAPGGATTLDLALGGSFEIMSYPIALDGKVTAQVCPSK